MTGLDIFAWIVLSTLLIAGLAIWIVLAKLPGRVARSRNHPQADAINVAGWLGALLVGVFWPLALVWAFTKPAAGQTEASQ
jgi:Kef-type K+ transport system membrane component KefB